MFSIVSKSIEETVDIMLLLTSYDHLDISTREIASYVIPGAKLIVVRRKELSPTLKEITKKLCITEADKKNRDALLKLEKDFASDFHLAEMAFQMNYRQVYSLCPLCKEQNPNEQSCGHLTFNGRIEGAF